MRALGRVLVVLPVLAGWGVTAPPQAREGPRPLRVAVLVVDGVELLDASGPTEVFVAASIEGERRYEVFTVAPEEGGVEILGFGELQPHHTFADCPEPDVLVIPGGGIVARRGDETLLEWIRERGRRGCVLFSVCSGALVLAEAGLLDGLEATTHHRALKVLEKAAPKARVVEGRRFVDNGQVLTSAGVSSGVDAALHLVERFSGEETAEKTSAYLEWKARG